MSDTPKSDAALKRFPSFTEKVLARLYRGRDDYGDSSFERSPLELIEEIQQELQDVCGWSFLEHDKLEQLKARIVSIEESSRSSSVAAPH